MPLAGYGVLAGTVVDQRAEGGLLLHYPAQDQWVGVFLAFQSQAWHTDDQTGHTIARSPEPEHR